jgi:hypothetical protein
MANTHFSGPVYSTGGFVGDVTATNVTATNVTTTLLAFTGAAGSATTPASFSATKYITIKANGTTYYIPAATAAW